jgi:hypothetical protein
VQPDKTVKNCYMDISLPERINDYAYFVEDNELRQVRPHKVPGNVIPAIAIDCFGVYELFYSKIAPEVGIEVLRRGLSLGWKPPIAEDLGYILRDEGRYREAAEMFQLAVEEGPSCSYIHEELAQALAKAHDAEAPR